MFIGLTPKPTVDKPCFSGILSLSMRLELEILDGPHKGKRLLLRNGLKLGRGQGPLSFDDGEMSDLHAVITFDQNKSWNIEC